MKDVWCFWGVSLCYLTLHQGAPAGSEIQVKRFTCQEMGNSQPNNQPASWLSRHEPVTNEFHVTVNIKQQKNSPKVLSPESKKWSLIAFFQVNGSVIPNYASMICIDWQEESDDNGLCLPAIILVTKEEGDVFRHWSTFLLKWSTILFQRMECGLRLPGNWIILCCVILKKYRAVNVFRATIYIPISLIPSPNSFEHKSVRNLDLDPQVPRHAFTGNRFSAKIPLLCSFKCVSKNPGPWKNNRYFTVHKFSTLKHG